MIGALALATAFGAALVAFVLARPAVEARFPPRSAHPAGLHDLAAMEYGPLVLASSYDPAAHHHPAFLVDRRARPTQLEKWASAPGDRRPWVEIHWIGPHDLSEVVVVHGAAFEGAVAPIRRYLITCLREGSPAAALAVEGNTQAVARHALACSAATGVRLDLLPPGADVVRLYEVEAWGR